MSYLGIDFGSSKVGIAYAPRKSVAFRLTVLNYDGSFWQFLQELVKEHKAEVIVVGLPYSLSGRVSSQTKEVEKFLKEIKKHLRGVKVVSYDERLTTQEARRNVSSREDDNAEAARIILQGYLDGPGK